MTHRQCKCGRYFEWSSLAAFAEAVMNKILALRNRKPIAPLCEICRRDQQLNLWQ